MNFKYFSFIIQLYLVKLVDQKFATSILFLSDFNETRLITGVLRVFAVSYFNCARGTRENRRLKRENKRTHGRIGRNSGEINNTRTARINEARRVDLHSRDPRRRGGLEERRRRLPDGNIFADAKFDRRSLDHLTHMAQAFNHRRAARFNRLEAESPAQLSSVARKIPGNGGDARIGPNYRI